MANCPSLSLVLIRPTPKSETQITIPAAPPVNPPVNPPAVIPTELTREPALPEDDDFVLVEKSSLLLETPTPLADTSIRQTENADISSTPHYPDHSVFKCPGCHTHFHSFSTFVIHIDSGACSSASVSQQINNEINAFAVQLFRNLSVISESG